MTGIVYFSDPVATWIITIWAVRIQREISTATFSVALFELYTTAIFLPLVVKSETTTGTPVAVRLTWSTVFLNCISGIIILFGVFLCAECALLNEKYPERSVFTCRLARLSLTMASGTPLLFQSMTRPRRFGSGAECTS